MNNLKTIKGRQEQQSSLSERFDNLLKDTIIDFGAGPVPKTTTFQNSKTTSINSTIGSPNIQGEYSMNPYQNFEPGCTSAQKDNPYWGFGPSSDSQLVVNENAAELLRKRLSSASWKVAPIVLSGSSDCYQSIEEKLELTRSILEVLWEHRHPVNIITKNALILRDLDILKKMALHNLVKVTISLSTLDDRFRQKLEPSSSSVFARLRTVKHLASEGIPVTVLAAPIIPGLNDHEIMPLVRTVASHGALDINHIVIRINNETEDDFRDWLQKTYPNKYDTVMNQIANLHKGGKVKNNKLGQRVIGAGSFSESVRDQMRLAKRVYFNEIKTVELDTELFESIKNPQLTLFG